MQPHIMKSQSWEQLAKDRAAWRRKIRDGAVIRDNQESTGQRQMQTKT